MYINTFKGNNFNIQNIVGKIQSQVLEKFNLFFNNKKVYFRHDEL